MYLHTGEREAWGKCWAAFTWHFPPCLVCDKGAKLLQRGMYTSQAAAVACSQEAGGDTDLVAGAATQPLHSPSLSCSLCSCYASAMHQCKGGKDTAGFFPTVQRIYKNTYCNILLSQTCSLTSWIFSLFQHKRQQLNKTVVFSKSKKRKVLSKGYCYP